MREYKIKKDLSPTEFLVWKGYAKIISETGVMPTCEDVALEVGSAMYTIQQAIRSMRDFGYVRTEGNRQAMIMHILKWPEGITPRECRKRLKAVESREEEAAPDLSRFYQVEEKGPRICVTPGCRLPRQPGRERCAGCISAVTPLGRRHNETGSYVSVRNW